MESPQCPLLSTSGLSMIAQISQRYRPEGMSEQAGAQEDILGF